LYLEHFDSKARVEDYMMEKAGSMIWNSVRMPAYFNNFLTVPPRKLDDESYIVASPMEGKPMYAMDVGDLGGCVASKIMVVVVMMVVLVIDGGDDGDDDGGVDGGGDGGGDDGGGDDSGGDDGDDGGVDGGGDDADHDHGGDDDDGGDDETVLMMVAVVVMIW
jgi:hypothetical protein